MQFKKKLKIPIFLLVLTLLPLLSAIPLDDTITRSNGLNSQITFNAAATANFIEVEVSYIYFENLGFITADNRRYECGDFNLTDSDQTLTTQDLENICTKQDTNSGSGSGVITDPVNETEVFAGEIVNTTKLEVVGESNETFSTINLTSLIIITKEFCEGEGDLVFETLDEDGRFTVIDSAELFLNDSKQSDKLKIDLTNENYFYSLDELEGKEIEVRVVAIQSGKEVTGTKTIPNGLCFDSENYLEKVITKLVNLVRENQALTISIILGIFVLAILSYMLIKLK